MCNLYLESPRSISHHWSPDGNRPKTSSGTCRPRHDRLSSTRLYDRVQKQCR